MVDYKEVLTDLHRRKAQLKREYDDEIKQIDEAILAIRKMIPKEGVMHFGGGHVSQVTAVQKPQTPYAGLTVREAAYRCLEAHGKPMKSKELADALIAGGFHSDAKLFRATVYSILAKDDRFTVKDGMWSLAEWKK